QIEELWGALAVNPSAPLTLDGPEMEARLFVAEAQVDLLHVRQAKVNMINRGAEQLRGEDARFLSAGQRAALVFAQKAETLSALDRYEGRAGSKRNRALRRLRTLQRLAAILSKKVANEVGPPRPKAARGRVNPYNQNVLSLVVSDIMK